MNNSQAGGHFYIFFTIEFQYYLPSKSCFPNLDFAYKGCFISRKFITFMLFYKMLTPGWIVNGCGKFCSSKRERERQNCVFILMLYFFAL